MYSLDVNFLKDRAVQTSGGGARSAAPKQVITLQDLLPALIGGGVGLGSLALVGIAWGVITWQQQVTEGEIAAINAEIAQNQPLVDEINQLEQQIQQANLQTQGLATVFQQIIPWSAILQDIRERVPGGIRLDRIVAKPSTPDPAQAAPPPPEGQPPPAPPALPPTLEITGTGRGYSEINDFILVLRESLFLNGDSLQLLRVALQQPSVQIEGGLANLEIPEVADFTIEVSMADLKTLPTTDLRRELTRKGALGLAVRLDTLEGQGIIETQAPPPGTPGTEPIVDPAASP